MSQTRPGGVFSGLRMGEVIREKVQDGLTGEQREIQYTQCKIVGNGSFGVVFQTKLSPSGEDAAIKRVLQDKRFKNRELQIMRIVRHPNIVELKAFYYSNGERKDEVYLNLVLEYVPETVYRASRYFNKMKTTMPILEVKLYIYQLFRSLAYIHSQGICHRDIKPQNLLLDPATGVLKLCDFGSAKILVENEPNVSYICSRYYRAPELIFGATNYTTKIDVWSTGCVMAELMLGQPLFPGESGIDQLVEIIKVLGTPTRDQIRTMNPNYMEHKFPQIKPHPFNKVFRKASAEAIDLISALLEYTPTQRLSAIDAMCQPFFDELRDPSTRLPDSRHAGGSSRELPSLFDFSRHELSIAPHLNHKLIPPHARARLVAQGLDLDNFSPIRKRRHNDDWEDRRPQRRRHEEPVRVTLRKKVLAVGEGPVFDGPPHERRPDQRPEEQVADIAKLVADNYFDSDLTGEFTSLLLQMIVEQPLKIPFLAAAVLVANSQKPEYTAELIGKILARLQPLIDSGSWREVKLYLRFLGGLQGLWEGDGVFPVLEQLFNKAIELQTNSSDDTLGLELVKIILLTIPYTLASSASTAFTDHANSLIEKTDVIASIPHALEALVDPFPSMEQAASTTSHESALALLQRHMVQESKSDWELSYLPRPWKIYRRDGEEDLLASAQKHPFPALTFPDTLQLGPRSIFPEIYLSVYSDQGLDTVPATTDTSAIVIRDALNDAINNLDFNRVLTARFLVDVDRYFGRHTFVPRGTPFDKLKDVSADRVMWKPEDVVVDAVFAQLFTLPAPEHKLVYYHSVLTETCKLAPQAVAPSLGRAIRFLYRNVERMDLELASRFLDWFAHHLSNFGFTWKWTEWVADLDLPDIEPRKAFILDAIDKEIRLSFAQRIKGTLPEEYKRLITAKKEQDTPDFKFADEQLPFSEQGKEVSQLIRKKATDDEFASVLDKVEADAAALGLDPKAVSTDVLVTAMTYVGSKSLSHFLAIVERSKDRLLSITSGEGGRAIQKQIITSVVSFWQDQRGNGVNIVDKLLNYEIVTPPATIEWILTDNIDGGSLLAAAWAQELVERTCTKVVGRVKQVVAAVRQPGLDEGKRVELQTVVLEAELAKMRSLFALVHDSVAAVQHSEDQLIKTWAAKWLKAWSRRGTVAEAWVREELAKPIPLPPPVEPEKETAMEGVEESDRRVKARLDEDNVVKEGKAEAGADAEMDAEEVNSHINGADV
ncbi:hypothetical protein DV736_g5819, partial [Chaetothyriales sp. CBS 134916]